MDEKSIFGNSPRAYSRPSRSLSSLSMMNPLNLLKDKRSLTAKEVVDNQGGPGILIGRTAVITGGESGIG